MYENHEWDDIDKNAYLELRDAKFQYKNLKKTSKGNLVFYLLSNTHSQDE